MKRKFVVRNVRVLIAVVVMVNLGACFSTDEVNNSHHAAIANKHLLFKNILIRDRDLALQAKYGFGDGLARPVANSPLLIKNRLYLSGDTVTGVSLSINATKQTLLLFEDMASLDMVLLATELVQGQLSAQHSAQDTNNSWMRLSRLLQQHKQRIIVEPYAVLDGAFQAKLDVRIRLVLVEEDNNRWSTTLVKSAGTLPLRGEGSWSENYGANIDARVRATLPDLLAEIPLVFEQQNKKEHVLYLP